MMYVAVLAAMHSLLKVLMDYNLPIMFESSDARARRRLALLAITLATIPCYCIGFMSIALAPTPGSLTPTPTLT